MTATAGAQLRQAQRRILSLLIRKQSHLLFQASIDELCRPSPTENIRCETLSSRNIVEQASTANLLLALNPDNGAYLADIRRDRVVGLAILESGRLLHYGFVFKKNKTACLLGLRGSTALIGNAFTHPEFRGRGLQVVSVNERAAIARANGFTAVAAETDPDNLSSRRGLEKSGMRLRGRIDLVILLNCLVIRWRRPTGISAFGFCL